ncbi:MAG: M48 family metallopeptidase [Limisphaerales bacterium]
MKSAVVVVAGLLLGRWLMQLGLERLNQRYVKARAGAAPETFKDVMDPATYARSVAYTLAKSRLSQVADTYDLVVLALVLFSGVLPWGYAQFSRWCGGSVWAAAGFLFITGLALSGFGLPLAWYGQFRLEERFGFNTTTTKLWWTDRFKGLLLGALLGYPLLVLILKLVEWTGHWWWCWAWGCVLGFQLVMLVLAPVLILPWFNKFTPLAEGTLRERLLALAQRTGFRASSIQVMDGSKRSRHSNAFFTGFGRWRRIVLFDTLVQQLSEAELEAVLAHEIGHYRKRHIPKLVLASAAGTWLAFYVLSLLAGQEWFYGAFGFAPGNITPALLLFALLGGVVTFWFSPLANLWSRRYEYQADAYAAKTMKETVSLVGALRKLNEKNLSNLTPHPAYSFFYYSHPTVVEREQALLRLDVDEESARGAEAGHSTSRPSK